MNRSMLLSCLRRAESTLAPTNPNRILGAFCFGKKGDVTTYDDVVGTKVPVAKWLGESPGIIGCVEGPLLMALLAASSSKDLTITPADAEIGLAFGRSRARLPIISAADFPFRFPKTEDVPMFKISTGLLDAFALCAETAGSDDARPELSGVTISISVGEGSNDRVDVYSSDDLTTTWASAVIKGRADKYGSFGLPVGFVKSLIGQPKDDQAATLGFGKSGAVFATKRGLRCFARYTHKNSDKTFVELFTGYADKSKGVSVPVTERLIGCVARAQILVEHGGGPTTEFNISREHKRLTLRTVGPAGEVTDTMALPASADFGESLVSLRTGPGLLARALLTDRTARFRSDAVVVQAKHMVHLVSVAQHIEK